jgi:hypothetical protein
MGYLDNSSVIVDAVLTRKGRELLSKNQFNVTQFALADDEIDYTLYNENHPNGTAFYGEAIEALPLIEAIPNENNSMISKLITLDRGTTKIPVLNLPSGNNITVNKGGLVEITPNTTNFDSTTELYSFTVADRRLFNTISATGGNGATGASVEIDRFGSALSQTVVGTRFSGTTLSGNTLFGTNAALATSIIVIGLQSGARSTITLQVNKEGSAGTTAATQPRSEY